MTIAVKLFGPQAQLAGAREVRVEVGDGATGAAVLAALGEAVPALRESLNGSRLAVDHAYVSEGQAIRPGQEVALIGMVSGG